MVDRLPTCAILLVVDAKRDPVGLGEDLVRRATVDKDALAIEAHVTQTKLHRSRSSASARHSILPYPQKEEERHRTQVSDVESVSLGDGGLL